MIVVWGGGLTVLGVPAIGCAGPVGGVHVSCLLGVTTVVVVVVLVLLVLVWAFGAMAGLGGKFFHLLFQGYVGHFTAGVFVLGLCRSA